MFMPRAVVECKTPSGYTEVQKTLSRYDGKPFRGKATNHGTSRKWIVMWRVPAGLYGSHPDLNFICPITSNVNRIGDVESYPLTTGQLCMKPSIPHRNPGKKYWISYGLAAVAQAGVCHQVDNEMLAKPEPLTVEVDWRIHIKKMQDAWIKTENLPCNRW